MKLLPLSSGMFAQVDDEDYDAFSSLSWGSEKAGKTFYAKRSSRKNGKKYLHREIMKAAKGTRIDHRDRNGLNCQKSNLRIATRTQNLANKEKSSHNTSGFKGVSWSKARQMWEAYARKEGKQYHLGMFRDLFEAARAYDVKAKELFGEFACLNFPQETTCEITESFQHQTYT